MSNDTDPDAYKCYDKGLLLPLVNESTWSIGARATIYILGLLWSFMGVSIIADVFMCSIEVITSKVKRVKVANPKAPDGVEEVEVKLWNSTVANLTLMALGSSAPEILLSVIEIVGNNFYSGELGPSTIVGSAAFNLLCISGICIISIPKGKSSRIHLFKVFCLTAFFCIFAYVWLFLVLVVSSPHVVELWEAIVTLLCFPILVILAFLTDKNYCGKKKEPKDTEIALGVGGDIEGVFITTDNITRDGVANIYKDVGKHPDLTPEQVATLATIEAEKNTPHSRAWYRVGATRDLTGGQKLVPKYDPKMLQTYRQLKDGSSVSVGTIQSDVPIIEFAASSCAIYENEKRVRVSINRKGNLNPQVIFKYETLDGTAEAGSDYIAQRGTMVFDSGEVQKHLDIEIIDDNEWEEDEVFFVKLSLEPHSPAKLGKKNTMQITIINDDEPGTFDFTLASYLFKESVGDAHIPVVRSNGTDGKVELKWSTKDLSAVNGKDYIGGEGILIFEHGEREKTIDIPIVDDSECEKDESFKLELVEVSAGGKLGRIKSTVVTIVNDDEFNTILDRVVNITNINLDRIRIGNASWGQQFREAMNVNGGDVETATAVDYILHFLTFGWKVIFACCPPPNFLNSGGWICFLVALGMIGMLTAIIGDLASIFGCLIGLEDPITAITFVAVGTSLPDLFASRTAALNEKYADTAIGNVTGSNSVNVFLGLGLPWVIATIYWGSKGLPFEVKAGSLSFSVLIYGVCAVLCIGLLMLRRFVPALGKAELGGPTIPKYISAIFLVFLWFFYITMSSCQTKGYIKF
ncbi:sodium/calcium exchanger 2-like isoform X2 [Ptychodera flava]|uniref:sodium/calcium exchanger 2-like isoform X2 n=1 Tax=Ptychodera flava TaxID=63121 RepID=UPI00396A6F4D